MLKMRNMARIALDSPDPLASELRNLIGRLCHYRGAAVSLILAPLSFQGQPWVIRPQAIMNLRPRPTGAAVLHHVDRWAGDDDRGSMEAFRIDGTDESQPSSLKTGGRPLREVLGHCRTARCRF